ncbi:MAG: response regulator [Ignavibacteriales bacterium]|nr:response regulator [Ignavibacteriales bacterium]
MESNIDVLYIEDNQDDINLTLRAFKKNNFNVNIKIIQDGEEAYNFLIKNKDSLLNSNNLPKVILLDLNLPKINGLQLLKALKQDEDLKLIPVVILTSSDDESDIVRSYKYGTNGYIVKPVQFKNFVKAIADLGVYWFFLNYTIKDIYLNSMR